MKSIVAAALLPLVLAGCTSGVLFDPGVVSDPADPATGILPDRSLSLLGDYRPRQPVGPENWRRLNEEQSPARPGDKS